MERWFDNPIANYRVKVDIPTNADEKKAAHIRVYGGREKVRDEYFKLERMPRKDYSRGIMALLRKDEQRVISRIAEILDVLPYKGP